MIEPAISPLWHHLPASTQSPAAARSLVAGALAGFPSDTVELAQLLVSETVTNAVIHADTAVEVQIQATTRGLRVSVWDNSPLEVPHPPEPSTDTTGGRGLMLVDELSTAWGWERAPDGKRIWFDL